jgi:RNase P subunit RPR2
MSTNKSHLHTCPDCKSTDVDVNHREVGNGFQEARKDETVSVKCRRCGHKEYVVTGEQSQRRIVTHGRPMDAPMVTAMSSDDFITR